MRSATGAHGWAEDAVVGSPEGATQDAERNGYAESFVGSIKQECLNFVACISLDQVDYLVATYMDYYNTVRPPQGEEIGNKVLDAEFRPTPHGPVRCQSRLGGLLRHYYRDAA